MRKLLAKIRNVMLDGLIVVLPIGLTGYLIWLAYQLIENYLGPTSPTGKQLSNSLQALFGIKWIPGLTIIYTALAIFLLGGLSRVYFGRLIQRYLDKFLNALPLVKKIYPPAKQIVEGVLGREGYSSFKEPVLIQYPRKGIYTIGFLTNRMEDECTVYVFTAPDPFTGKLLILPQEDLTPLNLRVEEALRMVISLGISTPSLENLTSEYRN
ncbi:MAG: DUF502 domain-containing protein [Candidatus Bipolaricaulota bacterium]